MRFYYEKSYYTDSFVVNHFFDRFLFIIVFK